MRYPANKSSLLGRTIGCWTVRRDPQAGELGLSRIVAVRCACGSERSMRAADVVNSQGIRCKVYGCTDRRRQAMEQHA